MPTLEDLHIGTQLRGLAGDAIVTVKAVHWHGDQILEVIYEDADGDLGKHLLYRDDEATVEIAETGRPWSFDGDGELLRLVSEAYRIKLAWLFDPYVAITTSLVVPLPHQISAVYETMLERQPLRFLLADDPGAGKTIMAGLLVKELMLRGDLERCLIVSPGSLTEQWQDELWEKFALEFELLTRDMIQASRTGNPFAERNLLIARLDQLARNEELQERLARAPEWDLVVCDEAHKLSATFFGGEAKYTKRYHLGRKVGGHCRNLLLMTATPHNGKEEDFQLFLALLDGDRFEGRYRDGVHTVEPSDLMRRMVKEELVRFDNRPLFPERRSYAVQYPLSDDEARLYTAVTGYVREEMNRAEKRLVEEGQSQRRINVGFALMTLQRRLASSPEAIWQSLKRRRERLESRLREAKTLLRGGVVQPSWLPTGPDIDEDEWDEIYEESPQDEREALEQELIDNATAAITVEELEIEIKLLQKLEKLAKVVRFKGVDAKWNELNSILDHPLMLDDNGNRRKLIIFTEFRDTLGYLADRVHTRLGRHEAVAEIHGGVLREDRRKVVHAFMNDPEVQVLVANDAAGEGVNLQRAHLMVNYDLPWNPNRLEQRFGRIHRIGQQEVCHLWSLVAKDTREGDVYVRLLEKIEAEREALGGKVFDVLGQLFEEQPLRDLLKDAILYGEQPEVKARLDQAIDNATDPSHLHEIFDRRSLVHGSMDTSRIHAMKAEMERAHARRLQPHFIQAFFLEAFAHLGGKIHRREEGRFEITHVPAAIRDRDRLIGMGAPVLKRYERVCFEKEKIDVQPRAHLVCPGSPLLDATIDLMLERYRDLLKRGAVLIDEHDPGTEPRLLFYLRHAVQDARQRRRGGPWIVSEGLQFVEVGPPGARPPRGGSGGETQDSGEFRRAGAAPYLDYRAADEEELQLLKPHLDAEWLRRDWEQEVVSFAIREVVPGHLEEVRKQRLPLIDKVEQQVKARLLPEINHWYNRYEDLKERERAGKKTRLPAQVAKERSENLADRLERRLAELKRERTITPRPPRVTGGVLVVPRGLLVKLGWKPPEGAAEAPENSVERAEVERLAMEKVMATEIALGREPRDVSAERGIGHDIESVDTETGELYFIEVKGIALSRQVVLTRSEVFCARNEPEQFRLAIVEIEDGAAKEAVYVKGYDFGQPGFGQTYSAYRLRALLQAGGPAA